MISKLLFAGFLVAFTAGAYAQTPIELVPPAPQIAVAPPTVVIPNLVGHNVRNLENELIGEIRSISVGEDGAVQGNSQPRCYPRASRSLRSYLVEVSAG
jgi:hypothetical protein